VTAKIQAVKTQAVKTQELKLDIERIGAVSAILTQPDNARACYVLAHGAGADMRHSFMNKVAAGLAGATPPALGIAKSPTWPATTEPWYVIESRGDVDGNGVFSFVTGSSFTGEVYVEAEGE